MPKDNENILFLHDEPLRPSEAPGFAPEAMVRCEECLRANPPTRSTCLYCAATLPYSESLADLRKPSLQPVENAAPGYNTILIPQPATRLRDVDLNAAASLLQLSPTDLNRIIDFGVPLPLSRTATTDEARLVSRRLQPFGIEAIVVADAELGLTEFPPLQIRGASFSEIGLTPKRPQGDHVTEIPWKQFDLIVTGRLLTKRVQSKERRGRRGKQEIVDASEFFADNAMMDLYTERKENLRILANSFDFSGLTQKSLIAADNFRLLGDLIKDMTPESEYDEQYNRVRPVLDLVWPADLQTGALGWRRERLGKYSVAAVTESCNEMQFTRYSRLRHFVKTRLKNLRDEN